MKRWLRRFALVYVVLALLAVVQGLVAAAADASPASNAVSLVAHIPVPLLAGFVAANAIPYLSALATRHPGWWTGAVTVVLSFLDAVLASIANSDNVHWQTVAAAAAVAWVVARLHLNTFLKGTDVEEWLHAHPKASSAPVEPPAAA